VLLLATIAFLAVQLVISLLSGTTGVLEKIVLLGVGALLFFIATKVQPRRSETRS